MSPEDCGKILALACSLDPRLRPPTESDAVVRAQTWSAALMDMPFDFAAKAVINHYRDSTDAIMPAHLNRQWKSQRKAEAEQFATSMALSEPVGVPMPPEIRTQFLSLGKKP